MAVMPSSPNKYIPEREVSLDEDAEGFGEWKHQRLAHVTFKEFRGHRDVVASCEFSGFNDEFMLTSSHDSTVKFWNLEQGVCTRTYAEAHKGEICEAHCSPDGQMIVSCGWDKKIVVRNTETGKVLWFGCHEGISTSCKFSHDGKYAVSCSDYENSVMVWDAYTGELIRAIPEQHSSTILKCLFSPQDDRIVTTSLDKSAKLYDMRSASTTLVLKNHSLPVSDACFTRDERTLATVSWDRSIAFYDVSTGKFRSEGPQVIRRAHEGCISSCVFSEDGTQLVTGGYDTNVCLWDVPNQIIKLKMQGHTDWVEDIAMSRDGVWVASASKDKTVRLWNLSRADQVPMVLQKRKAIGLRMFTCSQCNKPFSVSEHEEDQDLTLCVFCRLEETKERMQEFKHLE